MTRRIPLGATGLATVVFLIGCSGDNDVEKGPIRIGWHTVTTGPLEPIATMAKGGAILGADLANQGGGVLGRQVELVKYDDESSAEVAATMASQSLTDEIVAMFGGNTYEVVAAAGAVLQEAGIPYVDALASAPEIAAIGDKIFMAPFGDNTQAAAAAEFAYTQRGWTKAYVIWDTSDAYSTGLKQFFLEAFQGLGGTVRAHSIEHIQSENPPGTLEEQIQATLDDIAGLGSSDQPDFFYITSYVSDSTVIANYIRDRGVQLPIIGGDGWDDPTLKEDNVFYTNHAFDGEGGTQAFATFATAYEQAFGERPNVWAALMYDSLRLLLSAIKRANSTRPADITAALASTQAFEGATGTISYGGEFHVPEKSVFIVETHAAGDNTLAASLVPQNVPIPEVFK